MCGGGQGDLMRATRTSGRPQGLLGWLDSRFIVFASWRSAPTKSPLWTWLSVLILVRTCFPLSSLRRRRPSEVFEVEIPGGIRVLLNSIASPLGHLIGLWGHALAKIIFSRQLLSKSFNSFFSRLDWVSSYQLINTFRLFIALSLLCAMFCTLLIFFLCLNFCKHSLDSLVYAGIWSAWVFDGPLMTLRFLILGIYIHALARTDVRAGPKILSRT